MSEFAETHRREPETGGYLTPKQVLALRIAVAALAVTGLTGGITWFFGALQDTRDSAVIASWADYMRGELDSGSFSKGEQYYERVRITDGYQGVSEVNIRPFPGTILPTGKKVEVLGTIRIGEEILHAVLVDGKQPGSPLFGRWVAFRCASATGASWDPAAKQQIEKDSICAIYSPYAQGIQVK